MPVALSKVLGKFVPDTGTGAKQGKQMYWMLSDGWTGQGQIGLDVLKSSGDCGRKSGGAAGAWQTSGNYMLQHQGFRTGVGTGDWINEQQIQIAKQRAVLARQGAKQYKLDSLGLDQELVAGSVSLRYRLDAKSWYGPSDALEISFRSSNSYGQKKHVLDNSGGSSRDRSSYSVPGVAGIKALGYVSDLVIGSSVLGTSSGANVCAPTETSGSNLATAVITLKSLDKLKQAHTQFLN